MSEEKQTESFNWKDKLDTMDSLPEEKVIDKNASWDKLNVRLHGKPRRNKAAWYWMAAACLLLVLILPWMIMGKKEHTVVKLDPPKLIPAVKMQQTNDTVTRITGLSINEQQTAPVLAATPPEKRQTIKNIGRRNSNMPVIQKGNAKKENAIAVNSNATPDKITEAAVSTALPADTAMAVTTAAIAPKKLRVVHINELETATTTEPVQVASAISHPSNHSRLSFIKIHPVNTNKATQHEYAALKIPFNN